VGALANGLGAYWDNLFADPDTRHSILLTSPSCPWPWARTWSSAWPRPGPSLASVPGRTVLTPDRPAVLRLAVVAGLMFVLIFGLQGYLGPFLRRDGYAVMPYLFSLLEPVSSPWSSCSLGRRVRARGGLARYW